MAEPARQNNYEDKGINDIIKDGEADDYKVKIKLVKDKESEASGSMRQEKQKASQDLNPKNKITNLDDYRSQRNQAKQTPEIEKPSSVNQEDQETENKNPFQAGEGLDTSLMNRPEGAKSGKADDYDKEGEQKEGKGDGEKKKTSSEESAQLSEEKQKERSLKQRARQKVEEKVVQPVKQGTNRLLQLAWKYLIPTFGLTSLYINVHIYLGKTFGNMFFCKLGEEWIPPQVSKAGGDAEKTAKSVSRGVGLVEIIVIIIIDVILFFVVISILSMFINLEKLSDITQDATITNTNTTNTVK